MKNDPGFTLVPPGLIGNRVLYFPSLPSTNTHALELADEPANEGVVILAGEQTAGRGQHGRIWSAPAQSSVLMSVLLFPPQELRRPALLTAWAAVSVCRLIQNLIGMEATIKWPNDVLIHGRKVCGILIEQRSLGRDRLATVAGLGLNVAQPEDWFAETGLPQAASLAVFSGKKLAFQTVADQLIGYLGEEYERLQQGDLNTLQDAWKNQVGLVGKRVVVECQDKIYRGRLLDLTFAAVELEEAGARRNLRPEIIRQIYTEP